MATEPTREKYPDLPYSNFPVEEDYFARMKDVGADTVKYVKQYNTYAEAENWDGCANVLSEHPEVINCLFDAEKFNKLRDAILATQRYYLNNVKADMDSMKEYVEYLKAETVGINDTEENAQSKLTTYSAYKISKLQTDTNNKISKLQTDTAPVILSKEFIDKWTAKIGGSKS